MLRGGTVRVLGSHYSALLARAPPSELQLIDFHTNQADICDSCGAPSRFNHKTNSNIFVYRLGIQELRCEPCNPRPGDSILLGSILDKRFLKMLTDLGLRVGPRNVEAQRQPPQFLPLQLFVECGSCHKNYRMNENCCTQMTHSGTPYCGKCLKRVASGSHCYCLQDFARVIQCIPFDQLHLLTLSKWSASFGCRMCREVCHQTYRTLTARPANDQLVNANRAQLHTFFNIENQMPLRDLRSESVKEVSQRAKAHE